MNDICDEYSKTFKYFSIDRSDIINALISRYGYKSYLEIGVRYGDNFYKIKCDNKISVDPEQYGATTYQMTSDDYFDTLSEDTMFDIIFIDGMHLGEYVYRDIMNSIKHLNDNGTIICHDMNPIHELCASRNFDDTANNFIHGLWNGDCWKGFVKARTELHEYNFCMIKDCDNGIGVIRKGEANPIIIDNDVYQLNYQYFRDNFEYIMNPISTDDFLKLHNIIDIVNSKCILCAIAKNEGDYILDWVKYHLRIGFDKIIIYDNNDIDGEKYDDLLNEYLITGKVDIRNKRGLKGQQSAVYNECYNNDYFKWMAVIDLDEYIWLAENGKYSNIKDFLNSFSDETDTISLYWRCYGDNEYISSDYKLPVYDRFTKPVCESIIPREHIIKVNSWIKTIYRKGLNIVLNEHFINTNNDRILNHKDVCNNYINLTPSIDIINECYKSCYVKHFITKSLEEWYKHKLYRGHADESHGGQDHFFVEDNTKYYGWNYGFDSFFMYNTITEEKLHMLSKYGYMPKIIFKPTVLLTAFISNINEFLTCKQYIDKLGEICCPKTIYYIIEDAQNHTDIPIGKELSSIMYYSYTGYDLINMQDLSFNDLEFGKDDINIYINIGKTIGNEINWNTLDKLIGDTDRTRHLFEECINNNYTFVDDTCIKQSIDMDSTIKLIGNKYCQEYSYDRISDEYIEGNCFITKFDSIYDNLISKPCPYQIVDNDDILNNEESRLAYKAFQLTYPNMFKEIVKL